MRPEIRRLLDEHRCFDYLLDVLERQLLAFDAGESPDYALMREILQYLTRYPDLRHHVWEEGLYARVIARQPSLAVVGHALSGDHLRLRREGEQLHAVLEDILAGVLVPREALRAPGLSYLRCYRSHLHREERDLFPAAERVLAEADWAALAEGFRASPVPWGEDLAAGYALLREWIRAEGGPALAEGSGRCPVCAAA